MKNYTWMLFPGFKDKALTLSYDDGVVHDKRLMEILDKNGIKCTFNLNSGCFAQKEGESHFTKEQALAIYKDSNHEVAVHGRYHLSLAEVPGETALYDIIEDRKNLEQAFGRIVKGMAYANGNYSDKVVEILKLCGIKYARTTIASEKFAIPSDWLRLEATCHHNNPKLMPLLEEFLSPHKSGYYWGRNPKLFYLWGHSYEFNNNDNWNVIEDFAEKAGNRDDVWYATNGEIYDYVRAFENLEFSVDAKIVYNPSDIDVYLNLPENKVKVAAGECLKL